MPFFTLYPTNQTLTLGSKIKQRLKARPVPHRTCVVCREVKEKRELVRVVRTLQGRIEVDETGKKSGRGAYMCRSWSCWEVGLKKNKLAHALKTQVESEHYTNLWEYAEGLKVSLSNGSN